MLRKSRLIVLLAAVSALGIAGVIAAYASGSQGRGHGLPEAKTRVAAPPDATGWRSVAEVQATLRGKSEQTRDGLGLTGDAIAATRVIYTFPASAGPLAGLSVFEVPRGRAGSCVFMLDVGTCWANAAAVGAGTQALAVQAGTADFDGPSGPLPIVRFGHVAPQVESAAVTCNGATSAAAIRGNVLVWTAPSADVGPRDCTLRATLANGRVIAS